MNLGTDLLGRIAREARRLRVGQKLPPSGPLTWEQVAAVRDDFNFMLDQPGVTLDMIAKAMGPGFSRGPLSRFRNLESPGESSLDVDRVARGVNAFMETLARRRETRRPEGWVPTRVAERMLLVIARTIELASIGLIYSDAGRGKSMTLAAASMIHPGSILLRVRQSTRRPLGLARALGGQLNLPLTDNLTTLQGRIVGALSGSGRALLVDEAHRLSPDALELLRDLHDECGVPIVLVGTVRIAEAVADHERFFGQFTSRIALRYDATADLRDAGTSGGDGGGRPLHTVEEIRQLYERDKVRLTDEGRVLLTKIANLPGLGGLRLCGRIVQVAASAGPEGPIDAKLILEVVRAFQGEAFGVGVVQHALDASTARVA